MSILIKNMDKPYRCDECFFTDSNDECIFLGIDADMDSVDENCPLVEVEEHTAFSNFDDKERTVYVSVD